jgi:hypothetical protein
MVYPSIFNPYVRSLLVKDDYSDNRCIFFFLWFGVCARVEEPTL